MATNIDASRLGVPPGLADAGTHVRNISAALGSELQALRGKLAPLEVEWVGEAQVNYQILKGQWDRSAHSLWGDAGAPMPADNNPPTGQDLPGPDMGLLPFIAHALDRLYENYMNAEHASNQTWLMK
ncbi:WXG100 family type VII secretion target [Actinoplanes sp. NPDC049265]|uniref:WXG100 family type VII secretion target n=1 Tax=Actinoplanes sp. NPDC049265 TaxID=3363902 RepID=UPI00371CCFCF